MADARDEWETWFDRHGAAMILLARSWVPSRADAEDVVQDAFVHFWPSRTRAADQTAYLFGCVKRSALDWVRSRGRRVRREAIAARPECESLFDGPAEQAERRAAIAVALEALPEAQREVLVLRVWGGLTFPQIAAALAIPTDTAASRCRYALDKLREFLTEEAYP
ncbi:MAG TPA: sigma-70 family RNA polymerase sigma factor [Fimbriiglobus sp.]|jgi:RNA polymerase sigma-70 factor (ECF subfamily)